MTAYYVIFTLSKNIKTQDVKCWSHVSLAEIKDHRNVVYITVSEHFSFVKIIHLPDRCGKSKS